MSLTTCPNCQSAFEPSLGVKSPWCKCCGADLKAPPAPRPPVRPLAADEPVLLTAAAVPDPEPAGRWAGMRGRQRLQTEPLVRAAGVVPPSTRPLDPDAAFREVYGHDRDAVETPGWAWVFVGACGIIPVLTLGGAVPVMLGFGGASVCLKTARSRGLDGLSKVVVCVAVTAAAWVGLAVTLAAVAGLQAKVAHGR